MYDAPELFKERAWAVQPASGAGQHAGAAGPAPHAAAVVALLESEVAAAVETLGKLEPAALAQHAAALVAKLDHPDRGVREAALQALGKLEPAALAQHAAAVVAKLEDPDESLRQAAVKTLGKLEPAALAGHADHRRQARGLRESCS